MDLCGEMLLEHLPRDRPSGWEPARLQERWGPGALGSAGALGSDLGGRLAVVTSEEQNDFSTRLVSGYGLDAAWLGATDERVEGRWVWVDGTLMGYSNWGTGQPNNKQSSEHYLVLLVSQGGKWSDQPNNSVQHSPGFICQWD
jgi:hypothetical protein